MSSKNTILNNIKKANLIQTPVPSNQIIHITYSDKNKQYAEALKSVGGMASWLRTSETIEDFIQTNYENPGLISTNLKLDINHITSNDIDDPHALKDVDLAIIKGEFAIAENGAVWVKEEDNLNRAIYFIAKRLLIVVEKDSIVDSMHEAYKKSILKKVVSELS